MEIVIVERTLSPAMTLDEVRATRERNRGCYEMRRVRHITSYISADGTRGICVFEGPDAASVRDANEQAGTPFDRVWTGTAIP